MEGRGVMIDVDGLLSFFNSFCGEFGDRGGLLGGNNGGGERGGGGF